MLPGPGARAAEPLRARGSQADTTYTCPPKPTCSSAVQMDPHPREQSHNTTPHSHTRHPQPPAEAPSTPDVRRSLHSESSRSAGRPVSAARLGQGPRAAGSDHAGGPARRAGAGLRGSHARAHSTRATFGQECLFHNLKARRGRGWGEAKQRHIKQNRVAGASQSLPPRPSQASSGLSPAPTTVWRAPGGHRCPPAADSAQEARPRQVSPLFPGDTGSPQHLCQ